MAGALAVALPVLAACGGASDGAPPPPAAASTPAAASEAGAGGGTTPMSMPSMSGMATGTAPAGSPVSATSVAIQNFAFSPATITVKVGTTVTWTNQDSDPHTVTSKDGGGLDSPTLDKGATYQYTFTKAGQYAYLCTIHPFMVGTVVVTP
ncbi:cupredoxin domain-containing protein [Pseudofrankia asymbiotica]|uniref:cupredoxin domain-containing protein n=1 Tax=Pseudofrankia asymbiotica TaxID=1834516 RepID=UPI001F5224F5|nr:cupredoxin family copper-binding protein [Pseudofrankia asymbiotica]